MSKSTTDIKKTVRDHYAAAITGKGGCCSPAGDTTANQTFAKSLGYSDKELEGVAGEISSFGCGNPVNMAEMKPGQVVLDLGSGAGLDLILAARKVGPTGKAIGLDMTQEMVDAANRNIAKSGLKNIEVKKGEMEKMPIANESVDWIISNCVINLSPEKDKVFAESFRVLKPGGRVMISDIVTNNLPEHLQNNMATWAGCLGGAIEETAYIKLVKDAGFEDVKVVGKFKYDSSAIKDLTNEDSSGCGCSSCDSSGLTSTEYAGKVASIKLSARKPVGVNL
jgi:ubiquinone/menaquinone biosynthesis C-methylase UbiE